VGGGSLVFVLAERRDDAAQPVEQSLLEESTISPS
jgi:hypothetical protein